MIITPRTVKIKSRRSELLMTAHKIRKQAGQALGIPSTSISLSVCVGMAHKKEEFTLNCELLKGQPLPTLPVFSTPLMAQLMRQSAKKYAAVIRHSGEAPYEVRHVACDLEKLEIFLSTGHANVSTDVIICRIYSYKPDNTLILIPIDVARQLMRVVIIY